MHVSGGTVTNITILVFTVTMGPGEVERLEKELVHMKNKAFYSYLRG